MAKRTRESSSSELESAQEPTKKQVLEKWSKVLKEDKPTKLQLLITCDELLDSPHLIQGPLAPYIYLILQNWRTTAKFPKLGNTGKEVANLVDYFHKPGMRLATARKSVAELLGRTEEAVKQAHLRYGRRDKSS